MSRECYICGNGHPDILEQHHIVPQRFGGSDDDENLVELCSNCHSAVEHLYDKRFYDTLDTSDDDDDEQSEQTPCHRIGCSGDGVTEITEQVWGCKTHKRCAASGCTNLATTTVRDCKGRIEGTCAKHARCQYPGCGSVGDSVFTPKSGRYSIMCHMHAKGVGAVL